MFKSILLILFASLQLVIKTQLSESDKSHLIKILNDEQNEKSGLYKDDIENTYRAVFSLKQLEEPVPSSSKICRELSYEFNSKAYKGMLELNELINCKNEVNIETFMKNFEVAKTNDLSLKTLFERVELQSRLKILNEEIIQTNFIKVQEYLNSDNMFVNEIPPATENKEDSSLLINSYGIRLLSILGSNTESQDIKDNVASILKVVIPKLNKYFYDLKENVGFYYDARTTSVMINSILIDTFNQVKSVSQFDDAEKTQKILNYLFEFKHNYYSVDSIFYFLSGLKGLREWPVFDLEKKTLDEERFLNLRLLDVFGNENKNVNVDLSYRIYSQENIDEENTEYKLKFTNSTSASIDVKNIVTSFGNYFLDIKFNFTNTLSGNVITGSAIIRFTLLNKLRLNHLKLSLGNPVEKADEKEITVEFPKRSFKSLKATQNSIIKLKVKVSIILRKLNFNENQMMKIEQILLKLRHIELNKSFSSYSSEYKKLDDYYIINFDLGDTNIIDPFDGTYEMTLLASDKNVDKPAIWNFGKIDIKFMKPMDPSTLNPSFKNIQKPKMEYVFAPENNRSNLVASLIFSILILLCSLYFIKFLNGQGVNLKNLPRKNTISFWFSLAFIAFLAILAYVYLLFWVRFNIMQTFFILFVLSFPAIFIGYKTLTLIKIDV